MCAAEHRDEIELALMEATLTRTAIATAEDDRRPAISGVEGGVVLVGLIYDLAARPVRKWRARARAQAEFDARTPEEIARQRSLRVGGTSD